MQVGDLVRWRLWCGLIVKRDEHITLVKWLHKPYEVENTAYYDYGNEDEWEVISEGRRFGKN